MTNPTKPKRPKSPPIIIGWKEHLDLPDLALHGVKAKIDTGARTSALHATHIQPFEKDGVDWVRFQTKLDDDSESIWVTAPIFDQRAIKNTGGIPQDRYVIRTTLRLLDRAWLISVSLADRTHMRFPMIVGRTALENRNIAVHTRRANLTA